MIGFLLSALMGSAAPGPCTLPESMPVPNEAMAGEGDADWCLDGADPFAVAGPDLQPRRQLVWEDRGIDLVSITRWRRGRDAPPEGWERVLSRSAKAVGSGGFHEILFQKLGDNLIVVTANPAWRIGNAVCVGDGGASAGYLPAGVRATAADQAAMDGMMRDDVDTGNIMCVLLTADGDSWRASFRGPQGRPLYEIDDYYSGTRMRVTAPGDVERYLGLGSDGNK